MQYPKPIQKLIEQFSKLPTVGPRTAARFVFYLLKKDKKETRELLKAISNLKKEIRTCSFCFNPFERSGEQRLCPICRDSSRDQTKVCLVEKEADLLALEETKRYHGLYFVLGGTIPRLKKSNKKIRDKELLKRLKKPEKFGLPKTTIKEVIIATNPTTEGEATALHLERKLKSLNLPAGRQVKKITRLGRGMPMGGELEYADKKTLSSALESRR